MPETNLNDLITDQEIRFNVGRDRVLTRLWEIASMEPERTRNGMSAQVKAISMIVAIEGLIPDRHSARPAVSAQDQPTPSPVHPPFYVSAWARKQQNGESADPQTSQAQAEGTGPEFQSAPNRANDPYPEPTPGPLNPSPTTSLLPRVPMADYFAPDTRVPFSIKKNPFARRR